MLDPAARELLDRPNFAHVATLLADGAPHSVAVWSGTVGEDHAGFFTQAGSLKARNLARDPRVALSLVDHDQPYRSLQLRGRVVETREGEAALAWMDAVCRRHTGADFPIRRGVLFVVEPTWVKLGELPFRRSA